MPPDFRGVGGRAIPAAQQISVEVDDSAPHGDRHRFGSVVQPEFQKNVLDVSPRGSRVWRRSPFSAPPGRSDGAPPVRGPSSPAAKSVPPDAAPPALEAA